MYFRIDKNNEFAGFYESKEQEGTFVEITIEDWQNVLNKQSQGEIIYYDESSKKLETIKLGQFEKLIDGKVVQSQEMINEEMENIEDRIDDTEDELEVVAKRIKKRIVDKRGTVRLVAKQKELNADLVELNKTLKELDKKLKELDKKLKELGGMKGV